MSRPGNEAENTFKKIELDTYSKDNIPRNLVKKKSQYLEKRRNDMNIKMSLNLEQIYKFLRNWEPKFKKHLFR